MKKFLTAALALVLLLTLAACGGREGKEDPSGSPALYGVSEAWGYVSVGYSGGKCTDRTICDVQVFASAGASTATDYL